MSSINVFGYHQGNENKAFARFRLLGSYYLAESICLSNDKNYALLNNDTIKAISIEIKEAILTSECSGQIANKLYGIYSKDKLKEISTKITNILTAKLTKI
jgi:hypothetical protein